MGPAERCKPAYALPPRHLSRKNQHLPNRWPPIQRASNHDLAGRDALGEPHPDTPILSLKWRDLLTNAAWRALCCIGSRVESSCPVNAVIWAAPRPWYTALAGCAARGG